MFTAIASGMMAVVTNRGDQYRKYTQKLEASAFVHDGLMNFNKQLSCPGGVIRIKKGSCDENSGITLSINELRRLAAETTPHSVATLGVLPPTYRGYDYFDIVHLRVVCYKQESPYDHAGLPMMTELKQQPCSLLKNIDKTLSPYVGSGLLSGDEDRFLADVKVIEQSIAPEVVKKIEAANLEIKRLEPLKESAVKVLEADLRILKAAYDSYLITHNTYVTAANNYNNYVYQYNQLAAACALGCATDDPRMTSILSAQAQMNAYYPTYLAALQQRDAAVASYNAASKKSEESAKEVESLTKAIDTENKRIAGYQTMKRYLDTISQGKNLVLRNSQLAAVQAQGGVLASMLRHGTRGAGYKTVSLLPAPDNDGLRSSMTPSADADVFSFGMVKLKPFCSKYEDGSTRLRFFAKVVDAPSGGFPGPNVRIEFEIRQRKMQESLMGVGKKSKDGWIKMPVSFTPENCALVEEDDPPLTGADNWKKDSLNNTKVK
jgi:hypothetical protein